MSTTIPERNRDLVRGATRTTALYSWYDWLHKTHNQDMMARVTDGLPGVNIRSAPSRETETASDFSDLINLATYNYAGLYGRSEIIEATIAAVREFGTSPGGVRLMNGTTNVHLEFEQRLAAFLGVEDAVVYSSGFAANVTILSTVVTKNDVVFCDELNHQSIMDGLRLSRGEIVKYKHLDMPQLAAMAERQPTARRKFIVTDGVFSLDGDLAPLDEICDIAARSNAFVIVDDAHATGAIGREGRGTATYFGVESEVDIITGSLSKCLPGIGGFAAGSHETMNLLRYGSNAYIYSASVPVPVISGLLKAIDILEAEPELQNKLRHNERLIRDGLKAIGLTLMSDDSHVIPVLLKKRSEPYEFARLLHRDGVCVCPVTFPAVAHEKPRLRVSAGASLTEAQVARALGIVESAAVEFGLVGDAEAASGTRLRGSACSK